MYAIQGGDALMVYVCITGCGFEMLVQVEFLYTSV